jgi:3-hydroxy-9,10-secoandrosta-1,3,5(10)-triene-9,17-dione monooxygenase reductase component
MITTDLYRLVMGNGGTGVTIVTTKDQNGQPYGLTVSSFTSVSMDPILVLVCLDDRLSGLQFFKESMNFGVSILSEAQQEVSRLFAKKDTLRPPELYFNGETGIPLIRDSLVTLECETMEVYPGGDHSIFLGKVQAAELHGAMQGTKPLLYFRGKYERLP